MRHTFLAVLLAATTLAAGPSIEPSRGDSTHSSITVNRSGGKLDARGITLKDAIAMAYSFPATRIAGPAWIGEARWDMDIEAPARDEFYAQFRRALADRFHLATHRETRAVPADVLKTIPNVAPKLTPSAGREAIIHQENNSLKATAATMAELAAQLEDALHEPVLDETGLTQRFDLELSWRGEGREALGAALRDQAGLGLIHDARPLELLVVDTVERPAR